MNGVVLSFILYYGKNARMHLCYDSRRCVTASVDTVSYNRRKHHGHVSTHFSCLSICYITYVADMAYVRLIVMS